MCFKNWLENGRVFINGTPMKNFSEILWDKHPKFEGVYMKTILHGIDCNNYLSSMIVKIEPGCEIGNHIHQGKSELHEILEGDGIAEVGNMRVNYFSGIISFIPENTHHKITAGEKGIILLAKFTPPLN